MKSDLRFKLLLTLTGGLLGGFVGMLIGTIAGAGTSVLLPGLGLIISGSLVLGVGFGLLGMLLGSLIGLLAAKMILSSRNNFL